MSRMLDSFPILTSDKMISTIHAAGDVDLSEVEDIPTGPQYIGSVTTLTESSSIIPITNTSFMDSKKVYVMDVMCISLSGI